MARLADVLNLVHGALLVAPPNTPQQDQLAEAQRQLVEMMWREAIPAATRSPEGRLS